MNNYLFRKISFFMVLLFTNQCSKADSIIVSDKLKAVYLIHISEYTTWPDEKMQEANFNICIDSRSRLNESLVEVAESKYRIKGKSLHIEHNLDKLNSCHIFYVDNNTSKLFDNSKKTLIENSVLTISSDSHFIEQGGCIQYYPETNKIRMRIDLQVLQTSRLSISSQILRFMTIANKQ